ncbi:16S rRNA (guanine966-N2)-methyltransferase [Alteromonadaceae bacterium 2753L.S.0a.02]|nr:16S rRNA (guanine966-N2)-methyltransferase [Alteromonadaceae bacterium 2753L.S.0a.02]
MRDRYYERVTHPTISKAIVLQPKNKKNQKNSLRIIGGQWRGRKLSFADADGLRPTGDRIRETLFNWLAPLIQGSHCLDLFAGTGALGLEALSRGAAQVTFVEQNHGVANALKANLSTLACTAAAVHNSDALSWLEDPDSGPFNIVFVDPPFAKNLWEQALTNLEESTLLSNDTLIYIESPREQAVDIPKSWRVYKHKYAGAISYGLWQSSPEDKDLGSDLAHPTSGPQNV